FLSSYSVLFCLFNCRAMKSVVYLIITSLLAMAHPAQAKLSEVDSLLLVLDKELKNRAHYTQQRETKISFLKESLTESKGPQNRHDLHQRLFEAYRPFVCDSAIHYLELNLELSKSLGHAQTYHGTAIRLANL